MNRSIVVALGTIAVASVALAVTPAVDVYLPSVGHAQGACPGGICSQWRTDVWIYNPANAAATVEIQFLRRDTENTSPPTRTVTVAAGETKEYTDIVYSLFNLDGVYGALRFVSSTPVVVTGRIYDENVVTNKGTGTAGQFFAGLSAQSAIGTGESTELIGLAQDSAQLWRSNFGFVETAGAAATLEVRRLDATGTTLATKTYSIRARESKQFSITDIGGPLGANQRVTVRVTSGSGKVLAFASRLDNRTGDPSTVEMTTKPAAAANTTGVFAGIVLTPDGTMVDGGVETTISNLGLTGYAGVCGLPCGTDSFIVEFFANPSSPIAIGSDGSFSTETDISYGDSTTTYFSIHWTFAGTLSSNGVLSGTVRSVTTGGSGSWAACNGTVTRAWRAGWTGSGQ